MPDATDLADPVTALPELELSGKVKTAVVVAGALRNRILLGDIRPGESLPTEREMARGLGLSRNTVRDATRILRDEGLVEIRAGRNGGSFVLPLRIQESDTTRVADEWRSKIHASYELRSRIEPLAARWAVERSSADERRSLQAFLSQQPSDLALYHLLDSRLHVSIARMARSDALLEAVSLARSEMFRELNVLWLLLGEPAPNAESDFAGFRKDHVDVVEAIVDGRATHAEDAMMRHLQDSETQFLNALHKTMARHIQEGDSDE